VKVVVAGLPSWQKPRRPEAEERSQIALGQSKGRGGPGGSGCSGLARPTFATGRSCRPDPVLTWAVFRNATFGSAWTALTARPAGAALSAAATPRSEDEEVFTGSHWTRRHDGDAAARAARAAITALSSIAAVAAASPPAGRRVAIA
jgi:hypothetical protein